MKTNRSLYITASAPYGPNESFVITEIEEGMRQGNVIFVIPLIPKKKVFHKMTNRFSENTFHQGLFGVRIFCFFSISLFFNTKCIIKILRLISKSRNLKILIKNLLIVPKAVYLSRWVKINKISHIHVHWGSTTASCGLIISMITEIPWSMTVHRWDIVENNLLWEKMTDSKFTRVISKSGVELIQKVVGDQFEKIEKKIHIIHVGVKISSNSKSAELRSNNNTKVEMDFTILTPASLTSVKGHYFLIKALKHIVHKNRKVKLLLAGDGILRKELEILVGDLDLAAHVIFLGVLPHEKVIEKYECNEVNLVVLPSIISVNGEHEGIPVSLMEAMSNRIPVVSTKTGGIGELIDRDSGILVEHSNISELGHAIIRMIEDGEMRNRFGEMGFCKVKREFDLEMTTKELFLNFYNQ
jgi:colanic acid/amylovoran biosynthesis glycosyltransferase